MPRLRKPRDLGSKHQAMIEKLGVWLARKMNSTGTPLLLACDHLCSHGLGNYECKVCGVAKAIFDCEGSIAEQDGFNFVESVRKMRGELVLGKKKLEKTLASFRSLHEEDAKRERLEKTIASLSSEHEGIAKQKNPPAEVTITREGKRFVRRQLAADSQLFAKQKGQDDLAWMLARFPRILVIWDSLVRKLIKAEISLGKRLATPSLAERKKKWPRDYIETKVSCYLVQHGWTAKEIASAFYDSRCDPLKERSISEQVRRAQKSGIPPLVWEWPTDKNKEKAARLLALTRRAIDDVQDAPSENGEGP